MIYGLGVFGLGVSGLGSGWQSGFRGFGSGVKEAGLTV